MGHYLIRASYTQAGIQGVLKDGGTGRRTAIDALVASVGGTIESCYWALGEDDVFITAELPDNVAACANARPGARVASAAAKMTT